MGICSDCAAKGKTCCQASDIIVTLGDIRRIQASAQPGAVFWEYRSALSDDYCQDEDPNWDAYTCRKDGKRRMLKVKPDSSCLFLSGKGCQLSIDSRPLICRLYPYHYSESGLAGLDPYKCPPGTITDDPSSLPREFELSPANALLWHSQFYAELKADSPVPCSA